MKWLTILFALFIVLIIILADTGRLGILALTRIVPNIDKVGHFLLYGVLALLLNLTLFRSFPHRPRAQVAVASCLALAILIGLEEWSQQLFANRTFSVLDLMASYLGLLFFSWVALRIK